MMPQMPMNGGGDPLTSEDIRKAVAELTATIPPVSDFYILLPYETMPDVVKEQLRRVKEHLYFSENIAEEKQ